MLQLALGVARAPVRLSTAVADAVELAERVELSVARAQQIEASVASLADGLEGVTGDEFRKMALPPDSPRGGLLGMAAIMAMGSNGEVSSPARVVAPTSVKGASASLMERAAGPSPTMMSSW